MTIFHTLIKGGIDRLNLPNLLQFETFNVIILCIKISNWKPQSYPINKSGSAVFIIFNSSSSKSVSVSNFINVVYEIFESTSRACLGQDVSRGCVITT